MRLRVSIVPLCSCGNVMAHESRIDCTGSDGQMWFCSRCDRRYFVPWTYVDAMLMPELRLTPNT